MQIYIYIYICVCVLYVIYVIYVVIYVIYVIFVIYVIYIYTQYITLCVSHESWFMWDSPNATMALNQVSTVSHWDVAALAREFQVTKSERRDLAAARTRKQKLLGTLLFNREVNFWHFELTVVYSSIFKLNTLTFFLMSSETDLLHSLKTSKKKKMDFSGPGGGSSKWSLVLCLCLLYGSIGKESEKKTWPSGNWTWLIYLLPSGYD